MFAYRGQGGSGSGEGGGMEGGKEIHGTKLLTSDLRRNTNVMCCAGLGNTVLLRCKMVCVARERGLTRWLGE